MFTMSSMKEVKISLLIFALVIVVVAIFIWVSSYINSYQQESVRSESASENYKRDVPIIPDVPRDAIPPLDFPKYETVKEVNKWLLSSDFVIGVTIEGNARAYPVKIMNWHEIVNENISGKEIVVTYCPLCNSAVVFERNLGSQLLSFGNTGSLYESAMVMYDHETESYWYQVNGEALSGVLAGQRLIIFPSVFTTWGQWQDKWPDTKVLSLNTGYKRNYLGNPYVGYDEPNSSPAFPVSISSDLLPPKERVVGISVNGINKAYPTKQLQGKTVTDQIGSTAIEIVGSPTGMSAEVFFVDGNRGSRILAPSTSSFWFAWYAAYPDTELYGI